MSADGTPRPASPCIAICRLDPASGLCRGCWRTLDEIARWGQMDAAEREAVWQALPKRAAEHADKLERHWGA